VIFLTLPYFWKILQVSHLQDLLLKNSSKKAILAAM